MSKSCINASGTDKHRRNCASAPPAISHFHSSPSHRLRPGFDPHPSQTQRIYPLSAHVLDASTSRSCSRPQVHSWVSQHARTKSPVQPLFFTCPVDSTLPCPSSPLRPPPITRCYTQLMVTEPCTSEKQRQTFFLDEEPPYVPKMMRNTMEMSSTKNICRNQRSPSESVRGLQPACQR